MKSITCDYCGQPAQYVGCDVVYPHRPDLRNLKFWVCSPCDARVGCHTHGDGRQPLGRMANAALRAAKQEAHRSFDPIWKSGQRSRSDAYSWLAHNLGIKKRDCHIGLFDIDMCRKVVAVCNQLKAQDNVKGNTRSI
ncbi:conserved uncharacterised protein [Salmonella phage Vi01]|uniref:Uncharacterized protein n=1 Tax=Salmonella phage ViI TaxID=1987993 RepID=E1XTD5_BPSAV|nr:conserved uncharacterised protein [Salmonella phage Vi01]CBW37994.1 conserved uncharacterised protein [Salmonella phage Vi01]